MRRPLLIAYVCVVVSGCGGSGGGGGGSSNPPPAPPGPTSFAIGGTVSGLDSEGLVLQNNTGPDLAITANGAFSFPAQLATGAAYSLTIKTQPSIGPVQVCSVSNGSGTVAGSAVTNVAIVCVSRVFKFLYTTSTISNELRGYSINAADGTLTALPGPPIATGAGPTVPIPEPTGKFLYLSMRGSTVVPPQVAVYAADTSTGALTEIADSPYDLSTPPPMPNAPFVPPVTIHPSGAFGYLPTPAAATLLYGATIDATTGELTQIPGTPINAGYFMSGMAFDPTGAFAFVATNSTPSDGEIRSYSVHSPSGVLTLIGSAPTGGSGATGAFLTPGGDYLLPTNVNTSTFRAFAVDKVSGVLTPITSPISTGAGTRPAGVVYNRRNNVFYVMNLTGTPPSILAFRLDPALGTITAVGGAVPTNGASGNVVLHASGRFLFQMNGTTSSIQRFLIDHATGALTLATDSLPLTPGALQAAIVLDVSGKYAYVTSPAATTVSSYSINATTGALTLIDSEPTSPGALATLPFQLQ